MEKFVFVKLGLLVMFLSTSLAVEDQQLEGDVESWLRQRGQSVADDARAVDSQLARVRQLNSAVQRVPAVIPEASNYDVVSVPFDCSCRGWWCCVGSHRRRRSLTVQKIRGTENSRDRLPEIVVLGSPTELKLYRDKTDLLRLYKSPVARAELVTRPLDPATPGQVSDALGGLQHAVVATLTDGRRFLVVKGNQKGEGVETIVILADHMTDDWTKVTTKDISHSTLGDFIKAGGDRFDALNDNGTQAAARMMALP